MGRMPDLDGLRRTVVFAAMGAAAMAVLLPCMALVRDTMAHDWYAARKVTLAEAIVAVGFDKYEPTDYRLPDGRTVTFTREGMATFWPAARARERILSTIGDNALMGAGAGFAGAVLLLILSARLDRSRRTRTGVPVTRAAPVHQAWPSAARDRPGFVSELRRHDGGTSGTGLLVVPVAEVEGVADILGQADLPRLAPAAGPAQGTVKPAPALLAAAAQSGAAPDEAGAGRVLDGASSKPEAGRAPEPRGQSPEPPRRGRIPKSGKKSAKPRSPAHSRPDGGWF